MKKLALTALALLTATPALAANNDDLFTGMIAVSLVLYFFPTIVAFLRSHHQQYAILLLNLLLGWTGFGWIAALIWAATATKGAKA